MMTNAWEVFLLFAIPIGGGIPAGVLLAKARGIHWLMMTLLYFLSDVSLAFVFEPLMKLFAYFGRRNQFLGLFIQEFKKNMGKNVARFGVKPGPFMLVLISFGVDPMTGRSAAYAAGHKFVTGWAIAILGDMFFFGVVAFSTLALNNILGDGTWTAIIIMALMLGVPALVRKVRDNCSKKT